jgi:hypothetical protein
MVSERYVNTLKPGNVFRDWLVHEIGDKLDNKKNEVRVFLISGASHTVCRYEFKGEDYGVVAKFYAEPKGWRRNYDPVRSMKKEFSMLKRIESFIDIPRPIGMKKKFSCVLVTEYIKGRPLFKFIKTEEYLYDKLTAVAQVQRSLHDRTRTDYRKDKEFGRFHKILNQLRLDRSTRMKFDNLLGRWWYSSLLDLTQGCLIHNDANPVNYLFNNNKAYALDFESAWNHANFVHDLGIVSAELKNYFGWSAKRWQKAEPYIGHYLWNYSRSENEFHRITRAVPFFMALGLLRMARLGLDTGHREFILKEALACLNSKDLDGSG